MKAISCRPPDENPNAFGPTHQYLIAPSQLPAIETSVLLIHGYHCQAGDAVREFGAFAQGLPDSTLFLWPGGSEAIGFAAAVQRATEAGYRLRDAMDASGKVETIITHSLGARVALTAIRDGGIRVNELILMAPAVDGGVFASGGEFESVLDWADYTQVLFSRNDPVLKVWYPLGSDGKSALGLTGVDSMPRQGYNQRDCSDFIYDHGAYLSNTAIKASIAKCFAPQLAAK